MKFCAIKLYNSKQSRIRKPVQLIYSQNQHRLPAMLASNVSCFIDLKFLFFFHSKPIRLLEAFIRIIMMHCCSIQNPLIFLLHSSLASANFKFCSIPFSPVISETVSIHLLFLFLLPIFLSPDLIHSLSTL